MEQKQLRFQAMCHRNKIPDAPSRSEWMTVDECFDDIIDGVEKIYNNDC